MSTSGAEMQCREVIGLVTEYLEGTIADAERERLEAHLGGCEWCDRYIDQTRSVIGALGRLDEGAADPDAWSSALAAFREEHKRRL